MNLYKNVIKISAITVVALSLLLIGILSATREDKNIEKEVITLKIWGGVPKEAGPNQMIINFNKEFKEKGIQAEYIYCENNDFGNNKMEANILSGYGVDAYFTYDVSRIEKRVVSGMAVDLTEFIKEDNLNLENYFGKEIYSYYVNSKLYCIPTKLDQYGITINKDMFEEEGIEVPKDWDFEEFRKIAKKLTKGEGNNKRFGMFFCTQQDLSYLTNYMAARSMGGDPLYKRDGKSTNFDSKELKILVELVNNMMNVDGSAPTHIESITQKLTQESMFLSGKCAMTIGPWVIRNVKDQEKYPHNFTTAFIPYPVVDKNQINYNQGGLGDYLSICPNSKYQKETFEFMKWYATKGVLSMVEGGRIPAYKGFDSNEIMELLLKDSNGSIDPVSAKDVLITSKQNYAIPSITDSISDINKIMTDEFEQIFTLQKTVEDGLKEAKQRGDTILKAKYN